MPCRFAGYSAALMQRVMHNANATFEPSAVQLLPAKQVSQLTKCFGEDGCCIN